MAGNIKIKEIGFKNIKYYYFDDMISRNDSSSKHIKVNKNFTMIFFFTKLYMNHQMEPLYLNFNTINGYIEDNNEI